MICNSLPLSGPSHHYLTSANLVWFQGHCFHITSKICFKRSCSIPKRYIHKIITFKLLINHESSHFQLNETKKVSYNHFNTLTSIHTQARYSSCLPKTFRILMYNVLLLVNFLRITVTITLLKKQPIHLCYMKNIVKMYNGI